MSIKFLRARRSHFLLFFFDPVESLDSQYDSAIYLLYAYCVKTKKQKKKRNCGSFSNIFLFSAHLQKFRIEKVRHADQT